jgi:hypothetical protein
MGAHAEQRGFALNHPEHLEQGGRLYDKLLQVSKEPFVAFNPDEYALSEACGLSLVVDPSTRWKYAQNPPSRRRSGSVLRDEPGCRRGHPSRDGP